MCANRKVRISFGLVLSLVLAALCTAVTQAQEEEGAVKAVDFKLFAPGLPSEKEAGFAPDTNTTPGKRSPILQRLHQARLQGDMDEVKRIDAMLPMPSREGDSAGPIIRRKPTSTGGPGDLGLMGSDPKQNNLGGVEKVMGFGDDIHVRNFNNDSFERHQCMASDSQGNLYVAWQDDALGKDYIQVYWSQDGGNSWSGYGYVVNYGADLKEPSLAVAEGSTPRLILAYIVDDGTNIPVPEIAYSDLGSPSFSFASVPVWADWDGYSKPVVVTDHPRYYGWFAYLTCQGDYDIPSNDRNVCSWRSTDQCATWSSEQVVYGNFDTDPWLDPDITFGTTEDRVFISTYNDQTKTICLIYSNNYAVSYGMIMSVYTANIYHQPDYRVDPEVAAAMYDDNVMICCCLKNAGIDTIWQGYSTDAGETCAGMWPFFSTPVAPARAANLTANQKGGSFHVAYTEEYYVYRAYRPQDLASYWVAPRTPVNDYDRASETYPKKGITSNWDSDEVAIAWPSFREGGSYDYDTWFDHEGEHAFTSNRHHIYESSGGAANLALSAGPANAGRNYFILGSVTGTYPNIQLPGGQAKLPLHWDIFTNIVINLMNTPTFQNFMGQLDGNGTANAVFKMPPVTGAAGLIFTFAFGLNNPWDFASNPVQILIL